MPGVIANSAHKLELAGWVGRIAGNIRLRLRVSRRDSLDTVQNQLDHRANKMAG